MDLLPEDEIPEDILKDSVLAHIAGAYFAVAKKMERRTQSSATRGFIVSTLRGGATPNQNQIATQFGLDRTVVHRAVKSMVQDGLVSERKAKTGRAIQIRLTAKGAKFRERLLAARKLADESVRAELAPEERELLVHLLKRVRQCEF
jgi:DNA-binding MarR family transcriptional regulator